MAATMVSRRSATKATCLLNSALTDRASTATPENLAKYFWKRGDSLKSLLTKTVILKLFLDKKNLLKVTYLTKREETMALRPDLMFSQLL